MMDRSIYERVKAAPIQLQLTLALTQGQAGEATTIPLPTTDFSVPDFGICSPEIGLGDTLPQITGISCRSAFRQPYLTYIETLWSNCRVLAQRRSQTKVCKGRRGREISTPLRPSSASPRYGRSWSRSRIIGGTRASDRPEELRYLCPGTPVAFTRYNFVQTVSDRGRDSQFPDADKGDAGRVRRGDPVMLRAQRGSSSV